MLSSEKIYVMYRQIIDECREIFVSKSTEYGPTWLVYRWSSLVDQLWMKAKRIRTIEQKACSKISDSAELEYKAMINYAIIFLVRLYHRGELRSSDDIVEDTGLLEQIDPSLLTRLYDETAERAYSLCVDKNHDYNNAWQDMSIHSITDLIIIKILRMKNILRGTDEPEAQDVDEQLFDVINYSIFAIIMLRSDSMDESPA